MINLGLRMKEYRRLHRIMCKPHTVHTRVQLLDLNHNFMSDLSPMLLGGQVNMDWSAKIKRSLELDLLDPNRMISVDSSSPYHGAMFMDRMIRIVIIIRDAEDMSEYYPIPIFTGPITKLDRTGPAIKVEAQGKEVMAQVGLWRARTFKANIPITTLIRRVMRQIGGETKFNLPSRRRRTLKPLSLGKDNNIWDACQRLARTLNMQLFYNGRGVLRMRRLPSKTAFIFSDDESVISEPQVTFNSADVINAVEVIGAKPKGAKKHIRYRIVSGRNHPHSPWTLARGGVPQVRPLIIKDDNVRTLARARSMAKNQLRRGLLQGVEVTFDSLPIYGLEEMDVCRIHTKQWSGAFRLTKASFPLTVDGVMSVGYNRRVAPNRRQIRVRRKR